MSGPYDDEMGGCGRRKGDRRILQQLVRSTAHVWARCETVHGPTYGRAFHCVGEPSQNAYAARIT